MDGEEEEERFWSEDGQGPGEDGISTDGSIDPVEGRREEEDSEEESSGSSSESDDDAEMWEEDEEDEEDEMDVFGHR